MLSAQCSVLSAQCSVLSAQCSVLSVVGTSFAPFRSTLSNDRPGTDPSSWFDGESRLAVDWQRETIFWCQQAQRRILTSRLRANFPVLTLVEGTLCTGLALDVEAGELFWTSASGHLVFKVSYALYNGTIAAQTPDQPVYFLSHPDRSRLVHNNETPVAVITADGLVGDFGKNPLEAPLLLSVRAEDPDNGDTTFGNGDRLWLTFDRPTNISEEILEEEMPMPQEYVDSLFEVSEVLGSAYDGRWLDAST